MLSDMFAVCFCLMLLREARVTINGSTITPSRSVHDTNPPRAETTRAYGTNVGKHLGERYHGVEGLSVDDIIALIRRVDERTMERLDREFEAGVERTKGNIVEALSLLRQGAEDRDQRLPALESQDCKSREHSVKRIQG